MSLGLRFEVLRVIGAVAGRMDGIVFYIDRERNRGGDGSRMCNNTMP